MIIAHYCSAELVSIPPNFMNQGLVFISDNTYVNKNIMSQIHNIYNCIYHKNNNKLILCIFNIHISNGYILIRPL